AAFVVKGQIAEFAGPRGEGKERLQRLRVAQHHAMVGAGGGQQAAVGAQRQAIHGALVRALQPWADPEGRQRNGGERSAGQPNEQAAACSISRKLADGSALQLDVALELAGLNIEELDRLLVVGRQVATVVEKDDRPDIGACAEFLEGAGRSNVPEDDAAGEVAAGEPFTGRIEGKRVNDLRPAYLASELAGVCFPDDDVAWIGSLQPTGDR